MISLGGALGSALVGIVAPLVLPAYFELAGGLVARRAAAALAGAARTSSSSARSPPRRCWRRPAAPSGAIVEFYDDTIVATRNFYGVLRVQELGRDSANHRRSLIHGTILHGTQYLEPELRRRADDLLHGDVGHRPRCSSRCIRATTPLKVGVIGLGTGTLAAYGAKGDVYRFYDINPAVIDIAQRDFTYLQRQRRDDRARAGRRAPVARARAGAAIRRARDRRVLERRDPRAPHHGGGARRSTGGT